MNFLIFHTILMQFLIFLIFFIINGLLMGHNFVYLISARGSQKPVIAHLVVILTSKVYRKWECHK